MGKPIHIFKMSKNYTRLEVWHGSRTFHNRLSTSVIVPDKGLTRKQRHDVLSSELFTRFDILAPCYKPTAREARTKI